MSEFMKIELSPTQVKDLRKLWFLYGNEGKKHTDDQHKWIQRFLDSQEDHYAVFAQGILPECKFAVDAIVGHRDLDAVKEELASLDAEDCSHSNKRYAESPYDYATRGEEWIHQNTTEVLDNQKTILKNQALILESLNKKIPCGITTKK